MEPRFGVDLSAVRLHQDSAGDELSRKLGARAVTVGRDIFFRNGSYSETNDKGLRLLAHEIAHVVQQTSSPSNASRDGGSTEAEREASFAAASVAYGAHAPPLSSFSQAPACEKDEDASAALPTPTMHLEDDPKVPDREELSTKIGNGEFGGDSKVTAFIDQLIEVLNKRSANNDLPQMKQHRSLRESLTRSALSREFEILVEFVGANPNYGLKQLKHGWMRGLLSRLDFSTRNQGSDVHKQESGWDFSTAGRNLPKTSRVEIPVAVAMKEGKARKWPKVAPILALLLNHLKVLASASDPPLLFRADNRDSGAGTPHGSGYSVDVYLEHEMTKTKHGKNVTAIEDMPASDERFYDAQTAIQFLLLIDSAAKEANARWHVIYNDFRVADAVNRHLGYERVTYKGLFRYNKKGNPEMEWHGPAPLVLHFHLDVVPE